MSTTIMQHVRRFLAAALVFAATGCASYTIFGTADKDDVITPGTIAVISGSPEEADIRLAELFTDQLKKDTRFTVVSQDVIFDRIPNYPVYSFVNSISDSKENNSPWMPPDTKGKIAGYQSILGTRYILVVWTENLQVTQSNYGTDFGINFFSRLIEYPGGRVVGYSSYRRSRGGCATAFYGTNTNIDKMLGTVSEDVVEGLMEKTRIKK